MTQDRYKHANYIGSLVRTPWSSQVVVKETLLSVEIRDQTFHGVRTETHDCLGLDWPNTTALLWVFDDGEGLRLWEQPRQRPLYNKNEDLPVIQSILCFYETGGRAYLGIKWEEYDSPTWELETSLGDYADLLTDFFLTAITPRSI